MRHLGLFKRATSTKDVEKNTVISETLNMKDFYPIRKQRTKYIIFLNILNFLKPNKKAIFITFSILFLVLSVLQYITPNTTIIASSGTAIWTTQSNFTNNGVLGYTGATTYDSGDVTLTSGGSVTLNTQSGTVEQPQQLKQLTIVAGGSHSLALLSDGTVKSWGDDTYGQLGNDATLANQPTPVTVSGITTAVAVAAGSSHSLALLSDGTVKSWGYDNSGQLGNDVSLTNQPTPVTVSGITNAVAIAAGGWHSLAILSDGTVKSWGYDAQGQLGNDASSSNCPTPVTVSGISTATVVAAGTNHSLAVLSDGTMKSWGSDGNGQLGNDATLANQATPVVVSGISTASAVAAGMSHSLAVLSDGTMKSWGYDDLGQLGNDASLTSKPTPVVVSGISTASAVAAGIYHSIALLSDGTVKSWGYDNAGQLGNDASLTLQATPVTVSGISTASAVAAGGYHSLALLSDGSMKSWGYDNVGQLGNDASLTNQPTPVSVALSSYVSLGTVSNLKINASDKVNWSTISWNSVSLPASTTIKFRVRTSDDDSTWSSWSSYFTQSTAATTTGSGDISSMDESIYLEAELTLETSNSVNTPTLNDFTIAYNALETPVNANITLTNTSGTSLIAAGTPGAWTSETSARVVVTGLTCTGCTTSTNIRPSIEIKPIGTAFDNSTNIFTAATGNNYATVTGLGSGTSYHIQARAMDDEGRISSWLSYGANAETVADISVDQSTPTVSGITEGGAYSVDKMITFSDTISTPTATLDGSSFTSGSTVSTEGSHTLIVTDGAENTVTIHFSIDKTAPVISDLTSSGLSQASIQVSWTTDELSTSQIEYGLTTSYGSLTSVTDISPMVTSHSVTLTGLTSGSTYHFRAKTTDALGTSGVSADQTFNVYELITADITTNFTKNSASIKFNTFPSGVTEGINFSISNTTTPNILTPSPTGKAIKIVYSISATADFTTPVTTGFSAHLTFSYPSADNASEANYALLYWNGSSWSATGISNVSINTTANTISFDTTHFTDFGVFGQTPPTTVVTDPADGSVISNLTSISGTISSENGVSAASQVTLAILSGSLYWSGLVFTSTETWLEATSISGTLPDYTWEYSGSMPVWEDGTYIIKAKTIDDAGIQETPGDSISLSRSGPSSSSVIVSMQIDSSISVSCTPTGTLDLGSINGTGRSDLTSNYISCNVETNNSGGYEMDWSASSEDMTNGTDVIHSYTPSVFDVPETWSIANTASEWGARLSSLSDTTSSEWGIDDYSGTDYGTTAKWLNVSTSSRAIVSRLSETSLSGDNEIILFGGEIGSNSVQPAGTYNVTITITVIAL